MKSSFPKLYLARSLSSNTVFESLRGKRTKRSESAHCTWRVTLLVMQAVGPAVEISLPIEWHSKEWFGASVLLPTSSKRKRV